MCSLHALLSRGKGRPENVLVVVEVGGPQVGSRRFVDTALLRGLRLAAVAKRDGQTYHLAGSDARVSEPRIVQRHIRADDFHISAAFPAHLETVLVAAMLHDPAHPHSRELLERDALRGLHTREASPRGS